MTFIRWTGASRHYDLTLNQYLWRWKSKPTDYGRPKIPFEVINLIRKMSLENPLWGAPRIHGELVMLGIDVSESTVAFKTLYVFVVLSLDRRRVVHFHVTTHPTSEWTARQLIQAFPFDSAPKYLIRDRDGIYGFDIQRAIEFLGMKEKVISARSPWQNGHCERVVGTITHLGLEKETPDCREIEPIEIGPVARQPVVGGLHSRYFRDAA